MRLNIHTRKTVIHRDVLEIWPSFGATIILEIYFETCLVLIPIRLWRSPTTEVCGETAVKISWRNKCACVCAWTSAEDIHGPVSSHKKTRETRGKEKKRLNNSNRNKLKSTFTVELLKTILTYIYFGRVFRFIFLLGIYIVTSQQFRGKYWIFYWVHLRQHIDYF